MDVANTGYIQFDVASRMMCDATFHSIWRSVSHHDPNLSTFLTDPSQSRVEYRLESPDAPQMSWEYEPKPIVRPQILIDGQSPIYVSRDTRV